MTDCLYRIATGKWGAGRRLPSVREAEATWGLDRRTVMKAYRHLASLGLVAARSRSGYFVVEGPALGRLARHRHELAALFERCAELVAAESELSLQGTFRYFAELAALRARERPECAFVECTAAQARGHAREITERLGVPCLGATLADLDGKAARVPRSVRTLFVSWFHRAELEPLAGAGPFRVHPVPIEVAPGPGLALGPRGVLREAVLVDPDPDEAESILADVRAVGLDLPCRTRVGKDLDALAREEAADPGRLVLLAPREWGALGDGTRALANVRRIEFRIAAGAWAEIAEVLGMPLGTVAG